MEDQKHYIIVDNETYELYDGNGNFYVTKANRPPERFPLQNNFCSVKETENNFFENLTVPVPKSETNVNCQSRRQLEPILIDNYCNMNYFTQAASDVTIYLNSSNENNFMENTGGQSEYFVDSEGVIDLTKFSATSRQKTNSDSDIPETESTMDLNKTLRDISNEELDAPEFIDISKLKLSYAEAKLPSDLEVIPIVKRSREKSFKALTVDVGDEESDEDEVIFVKEFKAGDNRNNNNKPLDLRRRDASQTREKGLPEPRRNPKRQVQLLKESFDLALKLSDEEIYYGRTKKTYREFYTENSNKSSKNSGAVVNSAATQTNGNYKEWPTEGLHERPVFNMATKKIEKFDFKPAEDKRKGPLKKNETNVAKAIKGKRPGKKGKRKAPNRLKKNQKEPPEKGISKEFATLTHETLQEVIKYVSQVKEYNELKNGKKCDTEPHAETGSLLDDANSLLDVVRSSTMEENLNSAVDILTDSCILYSLANDVCQRSVAKYLKSVNDMKKNQPA